MKTLYSDRIVFEDRVSAGYLHIEEDRIEGISQHYSGTVDYDCTGRYILPGLINIHSEYTAREAALEINKFFPFSKIFKDVEMKFLMAGVTTLFHTVELVRGRYRKDFASGPEMIKNIRELSQSTTLIDHRTHMEFPLSFIDSMDKIRELIEGNFLDYISYLGYFRSEKERYREVYYQEYVQRMMQLDEETVQKIVERVRELRSESNLEELAYIIKYAHYKGIQVGSTEWSSVQKLDFLQDCGINVIEFPPTMDTIIYAKKYGKKVLVDTMSLFKKQRDENTPDMLRAIEEGKVDILSSDTRSSDLLVGIFYIAQRIGLPKAVAMSTVHAARAVGLEDRGIIEEGRRADLIVVREGDDKIPLVQSVFKDGKRKYHIETE